MSNKIYIFDIYGKPYMVKTDKNEEYVAGYIYKKVKNYKRRIRPKIFLCLPENEDIDLTLLTKKYRKINIDKEKITKKDIENGLKLLQDMICLSVSNNTKRKYSNVYF